MQLVCVGYNILIIKHLHLFTPRLHHIYTIISIDNQHFAPFTLVFVKYLFLLFFLYREY